MPVLNTFKLLVIDAVIDTAYRQVRYICSNRQLLIHCTHLVNLMSVDKNV